MSILNDIVALVPQDEAPGHTGFAPTGAALPYTVTRPMLIDADAVHLDGSASTWDQQYSVYCAAESVEACYNLALSVMGTLQGARVGDTTLSTSMGYVGAPVEGHYESQVTVQLNQGAI
jgi:hypothetical protein